MLKKVTLALAAMMGGALGAPQTPAQLHSSVNTEIVAGVPNGIRASTLNTILNNIVDSYASLSAPNTLGLTTFTVPPIIQTFANCYLYGGGAGPLTCNNNMWLQSVNGTGTNGTAAAFAPATSGLWVVGNYSGTGQAPYGLISLNDTASQSSSIGFLNGLWVAHNINAGAGAGNRNAMQIILSKNVATPGTDDSLKFYSSLFPQTYVTAGDGGTALTAHGNTYGFNSLTQLEPGATYYKGAFGGEMDLAVQAGASTEYAAVQTLGLVNSHAVHGSLQDSFLTLLRDNSTVVGANSGIIFGRSDTPWPISSTGTLLKSDPPNAGTRSAANGVDWSGITFSGCAYKSDGFCIDPLGKFKDVSTVLAPTSWSAAINAFYESYYGDQKNAIVHRMNKLFIGESALTSGGRDLSGQTDPKSWVDDDVYTLVPSSSLSVGSPMGTIAAEFHARTSDFRAWTGSSSAGSEAAVFTAINDDADSIAAPIDTRGVRSSTGEGMTLSQMDALNLGPNVVDRLPTYAGGTAYRGTTYALLLTSGVPNSWSYPVTITNAAPGVVTYTGARRIVNTTPVAFTSSGSLPSPLVIGTTYYVVNANTGAKTFQLAATPNGAAITTTTAGSGTHAVTTNISKEITAHIAIGGGSSKSRKAIMVGDDALDPTVGASGGGVFTDLPMKAETRWINSAGVTQTSIWGDTGLFVINSNAYVAGNLTARDNLITKNLVGGSAAPVASSCGTSPTVNSSSTNISGSFTTGTATPTACTITFANAYPSAAFCTVSPVNAAAVGTSVRVSASSASAFTITLGAGTDSAQYNYVCAGK